MHRRDIRLSSLSLDFERDPIRIPPRPLALRHEDYEDRFDFTTLFYDCFWDVMGETIILIGPALCNLEAELDLEIIACPSLAPCEPVIRHVFLNSQVVVRPPPGTTGLIIRAGPSESFVAPQPNLCHLFSKRRVITTLSQDNELVWIRDWIHFNCKYHGCDGALIYDNGSSMYGVNDIYDYLAPLAGDVAIVVLSWPFKYGVPDWRLPLSYEIVDSLYCQAGMLEHARFRFLLEADSVLNTDIDELVITEGDHSIFDIVENSATGQLVFTGIWVENHPPPRKGSRRPPRHKDFAHISTAEQIGCDTKWVAVPARVPDGAQWHVHRIIGMPSSESWQVVEMRHFKAINTNWTVDRNRSQQLRTATDVLDPHRLRLDVHLQETLARIFTEPEGTEVPADASRPASSAYIWRVRAGQLAAEGSPQQAIRAAEAALSLMPDHPGFHFFLAKLLEQEKDEHEARVLRAEAEALRQQDPFYHFQRGRWLMDEGDFAAAKECFLRATELEPTFCLPYRRMAQMAYFLGRPREAQELLESCVRSVPADPVTRALLAMRFETKGRIHDALTEVETAIKLDPENPHYYGFRARLLRRIGELNAAEDVVRRGVELNYLPARMEIFGRQSAIDGWLQYEWRAPNAPDLHVELAEILMKKGDLKAAEVAARDALAAARTQPERYQRLSEILRARGHHAEAAELLEAAIMLARQEMRRPTLSTLAVMRRHHYWASRAVKLSRALSAAGRSQEAIAVLRETLVVVPDSNLLKENLAAVLAATGHREAAANMLRLAMRERPENGTLCHRLAQLLEATDPQQAIKAAKAAVDLEPDNPYFQDHLVSMLIKAGQKKEAEAALRAALDAGAESASLHLRWGQLMQRQRRLEEALAALRRAVELAPRRPDLRDQLVAQLTEAGRAEEAEAALREAIEGGVESASLLFRWSRLLYGRQRLEEALAAVRRAVELDPRRAYLHDQLVTLLIETGQDTEAEAALHQGLTLHPNEAELHFRMGQLLRRRGRLEEALATLRRVVELEPRRAALRDHLVALLIEAGRNEEAEAALHAALEAGIESGPLLLRLSRLLQRRRCLDEALAVARRAVELDPQKPFLYNHLVALLIETGQDTEAELALAKALGLNPDEADLHFRLSQLMHRRQRLEKALAAARRTVELDPQRAGLHDHLVAVLIDASRFEEAEAAVRDALGLGVESGSLQFRLSRLLQRRGKVEEALTAARRAVELDPRPSWTDHVVALLMQAGQDREAELALRQALELHPQDMVLRGRLSQLIQRRRRQEEEAWPAANCTPEPRTADPGAGPASASPQSLPPGDMPGVQQPEG